MKNKLLPYTIVLFFGIFLLFGCDTGNDIPRLNDTAVTAESLSQVVSANNQFAFDLYSQYQSKEGNLFFSPYSISTALAIAYEGAEGSTAQEMQNVLHFPDDDSARRSAFARLYNQVNQRDQEYPLNTANALWAQKEYKFKADYLGRAADHYGGKVMNLDFIEETEEARMTINQWVQDETSGKIKGIIPAGVLNSLTKLVITNAIYFKGNWAIRFDKSQTRETDFKVSPQEIVKAQMMTVGGEKAVFFYAQTDDLQILELPYEGEDISMLILLPKEDSLEKVEKDLTIEKLSELKGMMKERQISVSIPRFSFETKYFMADALKQMGMPSAFDPDKADFSGMTGANELYVTSLIHQAFIEVNEEGTEAAASTSISMGITSVRPDFFYADRPFIFIIQEKTTGTMLFIGRVSDPGK